MEATEETTKTSELCAVSSPARWGYEIVDVYSFGSDDPVIVVRRNQSVAVKGDVLRKDGELYVFEKRVNSVVYVQAYNRG